MNEVIENEGPSCFRRDDTVILHEDQRFVGDGVQLAVKGSKAPVKAYHEKALATCSQLDKIPSFLQRIGKGFVNVDVDTAVQQTLHDLKAVSYTHLRAHE